MSAMNEITHIVDESSVARFLDGSRIALIGASDDRKSFSSTINTALTADRHEVVPVNPAYSEVAGEHCYRSIADVPGSIDRAIVMVPAATTPQVVRECIDAGVTSIWLFKGIGGPGSTSPEATAMCREAGVELVDGACPLMFLEPTGWLHRVHRSIRRRRRALVKGAPIE